MLDPWIIEEIRRREEDRRQHDEPKTIVIELPVHEPAPGADSRPANEPDPPPRGIAIIEF